MLMHLPATLRTEPDAQPAARPALVVALHGCTQTAAAYDAAAGWSQLADRFGFAVLLPEQRRRNNAAGCFNWFEPADTARGAGEAASIRAMVQHAIAAHGLDRSRVLVTGLSAGAAFANVLLATYPDVFAAGALIAGLPYGAAASMAEAVKAMSGGAAAASHTLIHGAHAHRGVWPRISVWHGQADTIVVPANADRVVRQWLGVHGIDPASGQTEHVGQATRRFWRDPRRHHRRRAIQPARLRPRRAAEPDGRRCRPHLRRQRPLRHRSRNFLELSHRPVLGADQDQGHRRAVTASRAAAP